jgi:RNA polymerase sigma factor (sigma-70 family)
MISISEPRIAVSAATVPVCASREQQLEQYHSDCFAWAMACCRGDRSEAEDVLQSSYLKVLDGRATFGSRSSYKTWLFGVIRRTAAEHRRRGMLRRLWAARPLDGLQLADPAPDPSAMLGRSESTQRLMRALALLPQRQRDALHLVFYQDLTIREVANVLGISIGAARTHYERGKARLRKHLKPETDQ